MNRQLSRVLASAIITTLAVSACSQDSSFSSFAGAANARSAVEKKTVLTELNSGATETDVNVFLGDNLTKKLVLGPSAGSTFDLTVDRSGKLYVSAPAKGTTSPQKPSQLDIYTSGGKSLIASIVQTKPFGLLTVDMLGDVYTTCGSAKICEYVAQTGKLKRKILLNKVFQPNSKPIAMAADGSGDIAVSSSSGQIAVFFENVNTPWWKTNVTGPATSIAFDPSGNLYALDPTGPSGTGSVDIYGPGSSTPAQTIQNGIDAPADLTVDNTGTLYVLNCVFESTASCPSPPNVAVYASGTTSPTRVLENGVENSQAAQVAGRHLLSVDSSQNLYVANTSANNVVVFPPNVTTPSETISKNVFGPVTIDTYP